MFGRGSISFVRRSLLAVRPNKLLWPVFRLLTLVPFPALISVVLLCVLYNIAEYQFTARYFAVRTVGYVWKPAFPPSWRFLFLSLFVVPIFSFLQLLWISIHHLAPIQHWRRHSLGPSQGYSMLPRGEPIAVGERGSFVARDDQGSDSEGIEAPLKHRQPRHLFLIDRSPRIMFWFAVLCASLWLGLHYQHPGDLRYLPSIEKANAHPKRTGYANQEKIFIAAMFYNNEEVIPHWSDSIIKVIHYLGADNVFVSIVESESDDQSPALLRRLDHRLDAMNVQRRILTEDKTVSRPDNFTMHDRIHFLSDVRNLVLEPFVEKGGYDKVIFSNDIFFEPETLLELLYTAEGEYDIACGMDFGQWGLYDAWVLRDKRGRLVSSIWPYFFDMDDYEAMKTESPVSVFTCWNGIAVFQADPLLPVHLRSNRTLSNDPLPFALPPTHPAANDPSWRGPSPALTPPVRFRGSAPNECFSSECFFLSYDFRRLFNLQRIYVNPRAVVGYEWQFYVYFKWFMRHPVLKWWIEKMYDGAWMQHDVYVVGDPKRVWAWDGGDCFPW